MHSVIEKQIRRLKKGGPIFVPETLVTAIRSAKKKGQPFHVRVMQYDYFKNVKSLTTQMGAINVKDLRLSEIKSTIRILDKSNNSSRGSSGSAPGVINWS